MVQTTIHTKEKPVLTQQYHPVKPNARKNIHLYSRIVSLFNNIVTPVSDENNFQFLVTSFDLETFPENG